jgi:hypothetical protein
MPFSCPELKSWIPNGGTQKTASVEIISNALLNNNEIWLRLDYSADTGDPLYQKVDNAIADFIFATPAAQTASTKSWGQYVDGRMNTHAYSVGNLIILASNPGRVFICTSAGTSAGSEPAGYATAVDGGTVTDSGATFQAMYRQVLTVACPASKPALAGWLIGIVRIGKASQTVYINPNMDIA